MIQIAVKGGHVALVDDEDADLARHSWVAFKNGNMLYVRTWLSPKDKPFLHRLIAKRFGDVADMVVDHKNGDPFDNRRDNLRIVSIAENVRNVAGARVDNKSGYLGVHFSPNPSGNGGRWVAQIKFNGKNVRLGRFETAIAANDARLRAERELWGIQPRRWKVHV